ncbi:transcriptional regulator [Actinokineospora bangkokensis]|uniref:Transcriptional regulator n=1 Tax=Actinokineospora bangkokensis TaxID=1193682 RepID=A0A1Q9LC36_9PSEU|nr:transcriptional regulator [Actinokineospora bangkokensis]
MPVSLLMRELWGDEPPASWLTTLQTYILNLRKVLATTTGLRTEEVAARLLQTKAGGYVLDLGTGSLDLHRYQVAVASAREFLLAGDDLQAVRTLDAALRLWRGPAFLDVRGGRVLESKRRQVEESRLVAIEHMVGAQLRLGMYHEVLTELAALTVENPLHEGLHAQYMIALHSLDRRAEALEVFRTLRDNLVEDLGIEPGARVREVHQAILGADGGRGHDALLAKVVDFRWSTAADTARVY